MIPSDNQRRPTRYSSIVTPVEFDTPSDDNLTTMNANFNDPLINSAVATANCTNDSEIARLHQEQLYALSIPNSIQLPQTSSIDMRPIHELEADEALARKLQEEEYTRKSIVPTHRSYPSRGSYSSRGTSSNNHRTAPTSTVQRTRTIQTDAELAAQLQEEEDKKQRQQRFAFAPSIRPNSGTNRFQIPPSNQNRQQPSRTIRNHNNNNDDDSDDDQSDTRETRNIPFHDLFSLFQPHIFGANRGGRSNLEQRTDDFGPDDYENLLELDKSVANKPLTTDEINRLPTEKFRRTAAKTAEECTCNICWDEFEHDQITRRLPCLHNYHKDCIDKWLKTNNTCPICRISAKQ